MYVGTGVDTADFTLETVGDTTAFVFMFRLEAFDEAFASNETFEFLTLFVEDDLEELSLPLSDDK